MPEKNDATYKYYLKDNVFSETAVFKLIKQWRLQVYVFSPIYLIYAFYHSDKAYISVHIF